jgi:hypothetical protein
MVARTLGTTRDAGAVWTVRYAGLGTGLVLVLGAVLLGWLAWPALIGGALGGSALLGYLALQRRPVNVAVNVAQPANRRIRSQARAATTRANTRIAA